MPTHSEFHERYLYAFARRLRLLRRVKKMTQEQLAEAAQLSYEHVNKLERGGVNPSFAAVCALSHGLGTEPFELFLGALPDDDMGSKDLHEAGVSGGALFQCLQSAGFWTWDASSDDMEWTSAVYRLLGLEPGEVRPALSLILERLHPDDRDKLVRMRPGGGWVDGDVRLCLRLLEESGGHRLIVAQMMLLRESHERAGIVQGLFFEISERHYFDAHILQHGMEHDDLIRKQRYFDVMFAKSTVGIVKSDAQGRIVQCNAFFAEMLGYTPDELVGVSYTDLTHQDDLEKERIKARQAIEYGRDSFQLEKRYLTKDAGEVWGELMVTFLRGEDGGIEFALALIHDISAHKRAELTLRQRVKELDGMFSLAQLADEVQSVDELLSRFVTTVAPASMKLPEENLVRLSFDGREYGNAEAEFAQSLCTPIVVGGVQRGSLIMGYSRILGFIEKYEARLVEDYADRLGKIIYGLESVNTLRDNDRMFRGVLNALPYGVLVHEQGVVLEANDMYCENWGYKRQELIGKWTMELVNEPEYEGNSYALDRCGSGMVCQGVGIHRDGSHVPVRFASFPCGDENSSNISLILLDIYSEDDSVFLLK